MKFGPLVSLPSYWLLLLGVVLIGIGLALIVIATNLVTKGQ